MTSDSRLTARFAKEDRDWLDQQAEHLGVGAATVLIMMVRQARLGFSAPITLPGTKQEIVKLPPLPPVRSSFVPSFTPNQQFDDEENLPGADGVRAEEIEIPPDEDEGSIPAEVPEYETELAPPREADLTALMSQAPDVLAQMQRLLEPRQAPRLAAPAANTRNALVAAPSNYRQRRSGLQPPAGMPGSMTRPVGVNPEIASGNMTGDGHGNVRRDNFAHLGFVGTRSR